MNFEPIRALRVFEAVVRGQGLDPATAALTATEKARVADVVNEGLERAWRFAMWPALMNVKRITYRPEWSATTLYAADEEVMKRDADGVAVYWRAKKAALGAVPEIDPDSWETPEDFMPGFYYADHFVDEMDLAFGLFEEHPDLRRDPKPYACVRTHFGAVVADTSAVWPSEPWIKFRPMPPEYSWTAWAIGTAYVEGETCFYDGSTWQCLDDDTGTTPGTDDTVWRCVCFPKMFLPYVTAHALAVRLQDDDGKAAQLNRAERLLEELEERQVGQVRVRRRAVVRVC
jgi:hypothetical protein